MFGEMLAIWKSYINYVKKEILLSLKMQARAWAHIIQTIFLKINSLEQLEKLVAYLLMETKLSHQEAEELFCLMMKNYLEELNI